MIILLRRRMRQVSPTAFIACSGTLSLALSSAGFLDGNSASAAISRGGSDAAFDDSWMGRGFNVIVFQVQRLLFSFFFFLFSFFRLRVQVQRLLWLRVSCTLVCTNVRGSNRHTRGGGCVRRALFFLSFLSARYFGVHANLDDRFHFSFFILIIILLLLFFSSILPVFYRQTEQPQSGEVVSTATFDLYASSAQSDAMLAYLNALPDETAIAVAAKDALDYWDPNKPHVKADLKAYMASAFGAAEFGSLGFRDSYALVGRKGATAPIAESHAAAGSGSVSLTTTVHCLVYGGSPSPTAFVAVRLPPSPSLFPVQTARAHTLHETSPR